MSGHDELESLLAAILFDFTAEELEQDLYMLGEIKSLLGVSETEAHELLVLARFKQQIDAAAASKTQS